MIPVTVIDHVVVVTDDAVPLNTVADDVSVIDTLTAEPSSTVPVIVVGKFWATAGSIASMVTVGAKLSIVNDAGDANPVLPAASVAPTSTE